MFTKLKSALLVLSVLTLAVHLQSPLITLASAIDSAEAGIEIVTKDVTEPASVSNPDLLENATFPEIFKHIRRVRSPLWRDPPPWGLDGGDRTLTWGTSHPHTINNKTMSFHVNVVSDPTGCRGVVVIREVWAQASMCDEGPSLSPNVSARVFYESLGRRSFTIVVHGPERIILNTAYFGKCMYRAEFSLSAADVYKLTVTVALLDHWALDLRHKPVVTANQRIVTGNLSCNTSRPFYNGTAQCRRGDAPARWAMTPEGWSWVPYECGYYHNFLRDPDKIDACFRSNRRRGRHSILFTGDSQVRSMYLHFMGVLKREVPMSSFHFRLRRKTRPVYETDHLHIEHEFDPHLTNLSTYAAEDDTTSSHGAVFDTIVVGTGMWSYMSRHSHERYTAHLVKISQTILKLRNRGIRVLWAGSPAWPKQGFKSGFRTEGRSRQDNNRMGLTHALGDIVMSAIGVPKLDFFSLSLPQEYRYEGDSVHYDYSIVLYTAVNVLLNVWCAVPNGTVPSYLGCPSYKMHMPGLETLISRKKSGKGRTQYASHSNHHQMRIEAVRLRRRTGR